MHWIDGEQVARVLDMPGCIRLMKSGLIALSSGRARQMLRPVLPLHGRNVLGMMPAFDEEQAVAGVKVLTVFPHNYEKDIPSHQGCVLLFETETGALKAIVDAESITGIRTAAASAAVTDVLARPDATSLAVLGAGLQGRRHLEAMACVRPLTEVTVWDLRPEAAARYAAEMHERTGLPVRACGTPAEAVKDADIVCTVTPSKEPILFAADVKPGAHVNGVGASSPDARELAPDLLAAGKLFVDWKPAAIVEAGDIVLALEEGSLAEGHLAGEAGLVLSGELPGRTGPEDVTIFKSLGQAIQDLYAANYVADVILNGS